MEVDAALFVELFGQTLSYWWLILIGTALDDSIKDELRVTVVATGLDSAARAGALRVVRSADGEVNYRDLDKPTVVRKQQQQSPQEKVATALADDPDYLDIPAFLRRQAD